MKCVICGSTENLSVHSSYTTRKGKVIRYKCRSCNTDRLRAFRATEAGKTSYRKAIKKYEASHPERVSAWDKAYRNISRQPCEVCGKPNTHRHHPDPLKPLDVKFLCALHHKHAHLVSHNPGSDISTPITSTRSVAERIQVFPSLGHT